MGTRALVMVEDGTETLVTIYRQMDGYPDGLGQDIKDALGGRKLVNGYTDRKTQINGMGCAAAMLIANLKKPDDCGDVYLMPAGTRDVGEDFTYSLYAAGGRLWIRVKQWEAEIYCGPLDAFQPNAIAAE